jgi:hypothetical protein
MAIRWLLFPKFRGIVFFGGFEGVALQLYLHPIQADLLWFAFF